MSSPHDLESGVGSERTRPMPDDQEKQAVGGSSPDNLSHHSNGQTTTVTAEAKEDVLVSWEGPDDPANPLNWAQKRKLFIIILVSANTFNISLASTIFAPGASRLMEEFGSNNGALAGFVVSAYIVSFIFGPLVFAPLSELYGRNIITHSSNIAFLAFTIICAVSQNMAMFIVFRLLQGLAGCVPLVLGGGTIGDLMRPDQRGKALSGWQLGPLMGPVLGPIIGGYVAEEIGWRWLFWLVAIIAGVFTIASLFVPETYAPTLLERKAAKLRKANPGTKYHTAASQGRKPNELFRKAIVRPMKMLIFSPIVMFLALEVSIVYGYLYLLFTTFTAVFVDQYGFGTGAAGLAYLGLGVGFLVGLFATGATSDRTAKKKAAGAEIKPEHRLPPLIFGVILVPIGLFWYGWSAEARVHWICPIIGTSFIGLGVLFVFMPIQAYLIDAFTIYAASAIATNTVVRSIFGAVLPLAGDALYESLGLGWGNSLLGFIALATVPPTYMLMKYGEKIRSHPKFQLDL